MSPYENKMSQRLSAAAAVVVVVTLAVFLWSTASNKANVTNPPPRASLSAPTLKTFTGKYISFEYTSRYAPRTLAAKDSDLELYMLTADTSYEKRLVVSVSILPGGQLSQNSAYSYRSTDTADYTLTSQTVDGSEAVIATKADGSERTIFIPRGDRIAVFTFVTKSPSDDIASESLRLLSSFSWK